MNPLDPLPLSVHDSGCTSGYNDVRVLVSSLVCWVLWFLDSCIASALSITRVLL